LQWWLSNFGAGKGEWGREGGFGRVIRVSMEGLQNFAL